VILPRKKAMKNKKTDRKQDKKDKGFGYSKYKKNS